MMKPSGTNRQQWRREGRRDWWWDVAAGAALLLLFLAFFWRTLSGDVYQPADGGDLLSFLYPTYRFAAAELSAGRLPLWNPTLYGGAPFLGDIQAGFLYGPNLLLFLVQPEFSYPALQWLAVLHLFWAGLGIYVLLRTLRWPPLGEPPPGESPHHPVSVSAATPAHRKRSDTCSDLARHAGASVGGVQGGHRAPL